MKYERLPNFCYVCGHIGHVELDCEESQGDEEHQLYGDFLRASPLKRQNERDVVEQERERLLKQSFKAREAGHREGVDEGKKSSVGKARRKLHDLISDPGGREEHHKSIGNIVQLIEKLDVNDKGKRIEDDRGDLSDMEEDNGTETGDINSRDEPSEGREENDIECEGKKGED